MSLSCTCEWDSPSFHNETTRKARKEHKCDECGEVVKRGDTYTRTFMVYDGDQITSITCERCDDLGASLAELGYCWTLGELISDYSEYLRESGRAYPKWLVELRG